MCFGIYFDKFLTAEQQENEAHSVSLEGNHHLAIHAKTREEKERKGENATVIIDNLRRPEEGFGLGRRKKEGGDGGGDFGGRAPKRRNDASKSIEKIEIAPNLDLVPNVGLRNYFRT